MAETLGRTWNSPLGAAREPDPGDELSGLLASRPDLAAWMAMRCDRVAGLVGEIAALAHSYGRRLSTALGVFARPAPLGARPDPVAWAPRRSGHAPGQNRPGALGRDRQLRPLRPDHRARAHS